MTIERGDFFVVTRGFEYAGLPPATETKPQYSREHEGRIYRADEVCGPMVAATVIATTKGYGPKVGQTISLNTTEVEVMTVTTEYVRLVGRAVEQDSAR